MTEKERVLEICYTDLKHTYQIKLDDKGSEVLTNQSLAATTRIDTPLRYGRLFPEAR